MLGEFNELLVSGGNRTSKTTWAATAVVKAAMENPGSQEKPDWFKVSFLDLNEDIDEAAVNNKRLMLYFYQDGCPYCKKLLEDNFGQRKIAEKTQKYFDVCRDKLGMIPNVLQAYAFDIDKLNAFSGMYNDLMLAPSGITKLEREMIAVVVSSINKCFYCLVAHGAAVRAMSGDPMLGEALVMNYRVADLDDKTRMMLDFAVKLTEAPEIIEEDDREALRAIGFSDRDIWDIASVAAFFNMTNRVASASDMRPNKAYHAQNR